MRFAYTCDLEKRVCLGVGVSIEESDIGLCHTHTLEMAESYQTPHSQTGQGTIRYIDRSRATQRSLRAEAKTCEYVAGEVVRG